MMPHTITAKQRLKRERLVREGRFEGALVRLWDGRQFRVEHASLTEGRRVRLELRGAPFLRNIIFCDLAEIQGAQR